MGKRANIRAIRAAAEATQYEVRRSTLTAEERAAADQAAADDAVRQGAAQGLVIVLFVALFGSAFIAMAIGVAATVALWVFVGAMVAFRWYYVAAKKSHAEADAAEAEQRAARRRRENAAARKAQVDYHVRMLRGTDPVFMALTEEWQQIPPTRPVDRGRNEARQAERMVIIDEYAAKFAELERTGQLVPDHATTMRELVAAEQSWDARRR